MTTYYSRMLVNAITAGFLFLGAARPYGIYAENTADQKTQAPVPENQPADAPDKNTANKNIPAGSQSTVSVQYYGIKVPVDRVIFVIDTTESMKELVTPGAKEKVKKFREVITEADDEKTKTGKKNKKRERGSGIDWDKVKTNMDLAKAELIESINELDKKVYFTVLTYSLDVKLMGEDLVPATQANKDEFIRKIQKLNYAGGTDAFFDALLKAIDVAKGKTSKTKKLKTVTTGKPSQEEHNYDIFFLTDGSPTSNKGMAPMPQDQINDYYEKIKTELAGQRIKIHTIGVGFHYEQYLKETAQIGNQGEYVSIGDK